MLRSRCRVVGVELAAGVLEPAHGGLAHLSAAGGIDQHAHRDPGAAPLRQRVDQPPPEHAVLPQERLEMNRPRRPADLLEHNLEESAILQNLDRVAFERDAVGQAGERRQQLGKRRVAFDAQTRIAVALDRPDDDHGKEQSAAEHRDDDGQNQIDHLNGDRPVRDHLMHGAGAGHVEGRGSLVEGGIRRHIRVPIDQRAGEACKGSFI